MRLIFLSILVAAIVSILRIGVIALAPRHVAVALGAARPTEWATVAAVAFVVAMLVFL